MATEDVEFFSQNGYRQNKIEKKWFFFHIMARTARVGQNYTCNGKRVYFYSDHPLKIYRNRRYKSCTPTLTSRNIVLEHTNKISTFDFRKVQYRSFEINKKCHTFVCRYRRKLVAFEIINVLLECVFGYVILHVQ